MREALLVSITAATRVRLEPATVSHRLVSGNSGRGFEPRMGTAAAAEESVLQQHALLVTMVQCLSERGWGVGECVGVGEGEEGVSG